MSQAMLSARVQALRYEAPGIISVELRPCTEGVAFPEHEAGAHIDLHLSNGFVRSYSLLNACTDTDRYVIGVLKDRKSRGGSRHIHEAVQVGQVLSISAPRNNFRLDESAAHSVFVAGGIGITPILCMLQRLLDQGRPAELIYCARSPQETAFLGAIEAMKRRGLKVVQHFDDEAGGAPRLVELLDGYTPQTHFYACGPGPMLDAFQQACDTLGHANVHMERFAAIEPAAPSNEQAQGFEVELRRSGKTIPIAPDVSVLDALLDAGIDVDFSCREGICGACETKVLSGEVEHRDSILTAQERSANRSMMVCVSRCRSGKLVLDA
jgi:ferredoxin-NADP reductase